jgi:acetylornithine deacetylase/succinyl-diaminopimelate desuccinylase-like protein
MGVARNVIPTTAEIIVDARLLQGDDPATLLKHLETVVGKVKNREGVSISVDFLSGGSISSLLASEVRFNFQFLAYAQPESISSCMLSAKLCQRAQSASGAARYKEKALEKLV